MRYTVYTYSEALVSNVARPHCHTQKKRKLATMAGFSTVRNELLPPIPGKGRAYALVDANKHKTS